MLWVPIAPTVTEPADLLGKCDNTLRRFIPHSNGFADLLLQAKRYPNDLYVVVLDGINRAIVDTYLSPLLACYRDRFTAEHKRMLTLFHPNVVMESDPYYELACFEWPANVLLTGILSEATSTVVPPRTLWDDTVPLFSGIEAIEKNETKFRKSGIAQSDQQKSAVPFEQWRQWLEQDQSNVNLPELIPTLVEKGFMLRSESVVLISRFYTFLTQQFKVEEQMVSKLLCQVLIPQAIASRQVDLLLEVIKTEKSSVAFIEQIQRIAMNMEQVLI